MSMSADGRPCGLPLRPLLNGRPTGIPSDLRAPDPPLLAAASADETLSASMPQWLRPTAAAFKPADLQEVGAVGHAVRWLPDSVDGVWRGTCEGATLA
jgi:hypothetical protein